MAQGCVDCEKYDECVKYAKTVENLILTRLREIYYFGYGDCFVNETEDEE